jgi:hypothetical protein
VGPLGALLVRLAAHAGLDAEFPQLQTLVGVKRYARRRRQREILAASVLE